MTIDHNVCAAHHLFDEPAIGPLEEEVLGVMEEHDEAYAAFAETRKALAPLFERVLSAWLYEGAIIDIHDRTGSLPRCLWGVRVGSGNARNASRFRIIGAARVKVGERGDPSCSEWIADAIAISSKTGRDMSANTSNGYRKDGTLTLTGRVFNDGFTDLRGPALHQHERDEFLKMVAQAEFALATKEQRS